MVHPLRQTPRRVVAFRLATICLLIAAQLSLSAAMTVAAPIGHLVVSEVMTGGASASDELIEIYNPASTALPLDGLEVVYVTSTGSTISRRAAWGLGAGDVPPGSHVLVANELGAFAPIADATYAGGMAATGGSVAIRIQGASGAIDAVGWGSASSTWLEGTPASAPAAGSSLERLPGGAAGSGVDTGNNAADFTVRSIPDPQNSGSAPLPDPTDPGGTPTPGASHSPVPTATATAGSTSTPAPTPTAPVTVSVADARNLPDGTEVTIQAEALTASAFTDGGGYVTDGTAGVAVLLASGSFDRGDRLLIHGALDDRFAQRTIRASASGVTVTGSGSGSGPLETTTGTVGESVEGRLVRVHGTVDGSPTTLTGGLAYDVDDGTGPVRVVVGTSTGIATAQWTDGAHIAVVGVVGQRDSSGTGTSGYRVQPRDGGDVAEVASPSPIATPDASSDPDPDPTASPTPGTGASITIAKARAAAKNARVTVRGVVTLASGTVDAGSAVIQDGTGAILLRLGDEAGSVSRGELVEVDGVRSTKAGMESVRVTVAPRRLGSAPDPAARAIRTGDASEASEARVVAVRGAVVASARRSSSGTVSFEIDDGSGPLRVVLSASLEADDASLTAGTWVDVHGVLGQETTGAQPLRGYRVWPRAADEVRVTAGATAGGDNSVAAGNSASGADGGGAPAPAALDVVDEADLASLRVGATLVASEWPDLGIAGLLWDGTRLVAIDQESAAELASVVADRRPPMSLELGGLRRSERAGPHGIPVVSLGDDPTSTTVSSSTVASASAVLPKPGGEPLWVSLVGRLTRDGARLELGVGEQRVRLQLECRKPVDLPEGVVAVTGVGLSDPARILVPCDGLRPAPALALLASAAFADRPAASSAGDASTARGGATARTPFAPVLLGLAAVVVLAGGVRYRRGEIGASDAESPGLVDPGSVDTALDRPVDDDDEPVTPRAVTLVTLPVEHGR